MGMISHFTAIAEVFSHIDVKLLMHAASRKYDFGSGAYHDSGESNGTKMFAEIADKNDDDIKFHEHFGKYLKLGVHEDSTNRIKLTELLRFHTSNSGDELIWLKEYAD